jgi:membrane associated rhomboid family serine protease
MLTLYWFGWPLEQLWGRKKFLFYYFLTGIGAGIVSVPFYILTGSPDAVVLGASGAIFGLLMAYALIHPNAIVYFMFMIPIKVKWLVAIFMVIEFMSTASYIGGARSSSIANVAHLSGALIGYFYLRRFMDLKAWWRKYKTRKRQRAYRVMPPPDDQRPTWLH